MVKIVKKPWGNFKQFILNGKCTVKTIEVNPGQELSLQKHRKRREMWYFLTNGIVQLGKKRKQIAKGKIVEIGKGVAHRLAAGKNKVQVLEISFGNFDENDIVRLEDRYGRVRK